MARARLGTVDGRRAPGRRRGRGRAPLRAPSAARRRGGPDRPASRRPVRLSGARRDRSEHRRQDGLAEDARPPVAHAPGRAARPGGATARVSRSLRASWPTSATSRASPSPSRRSRATCATSCASWTMPARPPSSCSTRSARARIRPRARPWRWRSSAGLLDAGAMVAATTHYAELKAFATEHPGVTQCRRRVRRQDAAADLSADDRPARQEPGVRDRRAARPAGADPGRRARADLGGARFDGGDAGGDRRGASRPRRRRWKLRRPTGLGRRRARARPRSGVAQARREAAKLLADARRSADELIARAEREVADLRREMTRQRNLAGGRRGASTPAVEDLEPSRRTRATRDGAARGDLEGSPRRTPAERAHSRASASLVGHERWADRADR